MRIITVNLPVTYLKAIDGLIGKKGLYPSRSELMRVAIREFLIRELESAQSSKKLQKDVAPAAHPIPVLDENLFIQLPVTATNEVGTEYKTYRIVKK